MTRSPRAGIELQCLTSIADGRPDAGGARQCLFASPNTPDQSLPGAGLKLSYVTASAQFWNALKWLFSNFESRFSDRYLEVDAML